MCVFSQSHLHFHFSVLQSAAIDCIAESKMKKTINAVLKKFFAQEFALKCTAVKESKKKGEKIILKETQFYQQLFGMY